MMVLEGVRALDLSMFLSGPRASQILADFGAEVIKIEPPGGETMRLWMKMIPDQADSMTHWHRSKKGLSLDIRKPEGAALLKKLLASADVLIENLAPGALDKCGLGYNDLKAEFPRLVYCSISGFGKNSPLSHRVAFDIIAQATGGIMSANRTESRSPGVFFGDLVSGAYAAMGVMMALMWRAKTGQGQLVDISMQDVMYFHNFRAMQNRMHEDANKIKDALGGSFEDIFTADDGLPFWRPYQARDGYVAVVFLTDRQWLDMCDLMERPDLKADPRFSNFVSRIKNRDAVKEEVKAWMESKTSAEIETALDSKRIPCGRVLDSRQVNQDENLKARGMLAEVEAEGRTIPLPGNPIRLSASPAEIRGRAPEVGEHNRELLNRLLGLSDAEIEELKKKGVI